MSALPAPMSFLHDHSWVMAWLNLIHCRVPGQAPGPSLHDVHPGQLKTAAHPLSVMLARADKATSRKMRVPCPADAR